MLEYEYVIMDTLSGSVSSICPDILVFRHGEILVRVHISLLSSAFRCTQTEKSGVLEHPLVPEPRYRQLPGTLLWYHLMSLGSKSKYRYKSRIPGYIYIRYTLTECMAYS